MMTTVGEGEELTAPDAKITVRISGKHTDGAYELFEVDAPRGEAAPPHRTPWPKAYYVLHGRMAVLLDGELHDLSPGDAITIPPNAPHTFTVHTPSVQFLAFAVGDVMGAFFRDLSENGMEALARHGVTLLVHEVQP
ncbi:cupin domain-containing protein [Lentzea sp. PSKA42]|uniref:Cupin domain-containing protein n=1 Tax=Lentzea indica TaxID=2604800 RepID=A0ABX1FB44_9PSEU|nr:cupin domain-containing protein [Lentzea indica]NKE55921.1 cupin domain-containing protein [Lentzea indica]